MNTVTFSKPYKSFIFSASTKEISVVDIRAYDNIGHIFQDGGGWTVKLYDYYGYELISSNYKKLGDAKHAVHDYFG